MSHRSVLAGMACLGALIASTLPGLACPPNSVYGCPPAELHVISGSLIDAPPVQRPPMSVELPSLLMRALATPAHLAATEAAPSHGDLCDTDAVPQTAVAVIDGVEMPWIWQLLKRRVYDQLPRYEEIERDRATLSVVLSPVVVSGPDSDTVPGVGVSGDF